MHLTRPPSYACDTIAIAITNAMAIFPDDCLPPEGFFETREALYQSINARVYTRLRTLSIDSFPMIHHNWQHS
ncbi:hypothetical protein VTK26DRAFT_3817 [Humicola hyalothermophila]